MFTGIVEELGTVKQVVSGSAWGQIEIAGREVLEGTKLGDSIAVNGVCLTVTNLRSGSFTADVMAETMRRSNLGSLKKGDQVNLERAMAADGRFGGHMVSGHIDGTGVISQMKQEGNAVWVTVDTSEDLMRLIVEKGSIAIDGISLTVAKEMPGAFQVSIIPHTGEETTLLKKKTGAVVNLENDMIGKYVEKLMRKEPEGGGSSLTLDFLKQHGF
ncbi:MAG TPA: riboflavin synthase [Candidatus Ruminococcus avistercoris]|nr:riboflavin synthase [Candidatus Ruminococcus avistercoris]